MLHTPYSNRFGTTISNYASTRPAAKLGTDCTPGNNTKGSYSQILTALSDATYYMRVCFSSVGASAVAKNALVDIGIDPAGGSSYSVLVPDLMASCAAAYGTLGGVWYEFPIYIPAGATVATRGSVNSGTVGTITTAIQLFGRPSRPDLLRYGTGVVAFGVTAASSSGTAVTPGGASEGTYTQIGSATDRRLWWWQVGWGINDSTMTAALLHIDLAIGDATAKQTVIQDQLVITTSAELLTSFNPPSPIYDAPVGANVYVRARHSGTADSSNSAIVYGVY